MSDLVDLQGSWDISSLEVDGNEMPAPPGGHVVIEGERFQSLGMGAVYEGTIQLDPEKTPKHFDLRFTAGPEKGNRSLGIYELDGDTWRICFTVTGKRRPTSFATKMGSGHALETLTRGEAAGIRSETTGMEDTAPQPSAVSDAVPEIEGEWQMVACHADGHSVPESIVSTGRRVAQAGRTSSWFGSKRILDARYTVDRSTHPHTIDYSLKGGASQYGIWKLDGDVLHICFAAPGKARPSSFETQTGQGHTYTAWRATKR